MNKIFIQNGDTIHMKQKHNNMMLKKKEENKQTSKVLMRNDVV